MCCFVWVGQANRRRESSQTQNGEFGIRVLHRLTEGSEPTPAHAAIPFSEGGGKSKSARVEPTTCLIQTI